MRPLDMRKCSLEISTGAATTRFCVDTAAAEAVTSLERIAKSSAPVFFKPQEVAAKRNPRGKAASESACFMSIGLRSPLPKATSASLARRSRKGPPIRDGGESSHVNGSLHAHGFAPVFVVFLLRRRSKSPLAA